MSNDDRLTPFTTTDDECRGMSALVVWEILSEVAVNLLAFKLKALETLS